MKKVSKKASKVFKMAFQVSKVASKHPKMASQFPKVASQVLKEVSLIPMLSPGPSCHLPVLQGASQFPMGLRGSPYGFLDPLVAS